MKLLPERLLVRTSELDQGAWNYRGILGWISRQRLRMTLALLSGHDSGALLEVGYGSGVFTPALADHCDRLCGVDPHPYAAEVTAALADLGIDADLRTGSVEQLPYPDATFDTVVAISALEFVDDIDGACHEMARVLKPEGRLVVITPGYGPILDGGLRLLTGERAEDTFRGRRQRVTPTLLKSFRLQRRLAFPPAVPAFVRLYSALQLTRRS